MFHKNLGLGDQHIPYNWAYDDESARTGATGLVIGDIGKLCRQLDDNSVWMLTNYSPTTWVNVSSGSGALTEEQHKVLRQLIHFINEGPAEGFVSGAYKVVTGTVFPTAIVWYDEAGTEQKKIVEKLITWTGARPTTIVWKIYDASETLLATVTDVIAYSGPFETSRTRTIA